MIDSMDFSQTPSLTFLDLSENRLASIHGLETCRELLELNLNENRIARIGLLIIYLHVQLYITLIHAV